MPDREGGLAMGASIQARIKHPEIYLGPLPSDPLTSVFNVLPYVSAVAPLLL